MSLPAMNQQAANLRLIETASRAAWPALLEEEMPFGVLRFAQGVSRRANSMNIHVGIMADYERICAATENFYSRHRLPAIVRVLDSKAIGAIASDELDQFLARHEYAAVTPTKVMHLNLKLPLVCVIEHDMPLAEKVDLQTWLRIWHQLSQKPDYEFNAHQAMLTRILSPHCFLVQWDKNGAPVSCGLAVVKGDLVGLFGIATGTAYRGNGYATHLVQQLLNWGFAHAASSAYLQVEEKNTAALAVYQKHGFAELYSYWYREKQLQTTKTYRGIK